MPTNQKLPLFMRCSQVKLGEPTKTSSLNNNHNKPSIDVIDYDFYVEHMRAPSKCICAQSARNRGYSNLRFARTKKVDLSSGSRGNGRSNCTFVSSMLRLRFVYEETKWIRAFIAFDPCGYVFSSTRRGLAEFAAHTDTVSRSLCHCLCSISFELN